MTKLVFAIPIIENVSIPSYVWLGEDINIQLNCYDGNYSINSVYANTVGPNITLPILYFTNISNMYNLKIDKLYLDRIGPFNILISCTNTNNETTNVSSVISVYKLEGKIINIIPEKIYSDDIIEIDFILEKNGERITKDTSFKILINNEEKIPKILPVYDTNRGWIIKLDPLPPNIYNIQVSAFYDRMNVTDSKQKEIRDSINFEIVSIDNIYVKSKENLTILLEANEKGNSINIDKDNLKIQINDIDIEIKNITKLNNQSIVNIVLPSLSYGKYNLKAILLHKNKTYTKTVEIIHKMPVTGKITDKNNKGINAQIKFVSDGEEKLSISTDSSGTYSGFLLPGIYDIKLIFPQSILYLERSPINNFNDPIRYYYFTDISIPGIQVNGIYIYEIAFPFSKAIIEVFYEEKNIINENLLKVFKCSDWNYGKNLCNTNWTELDYEIDTVRNIIKFSSNNLSAFVIGTRDKIDIFANLNKEKYYLKDIIKLSGVIWDSKKDAVSDAEINLYNNNLSINYTTISDSNGAFLFEFLAPTKEGNYTLSLTAKKSLFINSSKEIKFEVIKNRDISILFTDNIQITQGDVSKEELKIINIGQTELNNITISIDGVPEYVIITPDKIDKLDINGEAIIDLHFFATLNSTPGTYSGKIKIKNNEISKEKIFGFTILKLSQTEQNGIPTFTGFSINLPNIKLDQNIYLILFALLSFLIAYKLKRRKYKKKEDYKDTLSDIKLYLSNTTKSTESYFDQMRMGIELLSKKGDEYGENN